MTMEPTPNTPAAVAAAIAADVQAGSLSKEDGDAYLAKLNLPPPAAPSAPPVAPAPTDPDAFLAASNKWGAQEQNQIRKDLDAAVADGRITPEQRDADLKLAGLEPLPPDNRTPEAKAIDAEFPPAKPTEFIFPSYGEHPGQEVNLSPEQRVFDTEARGALADAKFTRELGSSFAKEVNRVAGDCRNMGPAEREIYHRGQVTILEKTWKGDYAKNLSMANQLFRELAEKYPRLAKTMIQSGAGSSARVVAILHQQAELLSKRRPE